MAVSKPTSTQGSRNPKALGRLTYLWVFPTRELSRCIRSLREHMRLSKQPTAILMLSAKYAKEELLLLWLWEGLKWRRIMMRNKTVNLLQIQAIPVEYLGHELVQNHLHILQMVYR